MDHVLPPNVDFFPPSARRAFNAAAPAVAVMAANALAMMTGWGANLPIFENVAVAPPAWLIGMVWLALYASWGVARWEACRASDVACDRSRWVSAVLVWGVAYAFFVGAFGPLWSILHAGSLLLLAVIATARLAPVNRVAAYWIAPSLVWLGYTVALSVAALKLG